VASAAAAAAATASTAGRQRSPAGQLPVAAVAATAAVAVPLVITPPPRPSESAAAAARGGDTRGDCFGDGGAGAEWQHRIRETQGQPGRGEDPPRCASNRAQRLGGHHDDHRRCPVDETVH